MFITKQNINKKNGEWCTDNSLLNCCFRIRLPSSGSKQKSTEQDDDTEPSAVLHLCKDATTYG